MHHPVADSPFRVSAPPNASPQCLPAGLGSRLPQLSPSPCPSPALLPVSPSLPSAGRLQLIKPPAPPGSSFQRQAPPILYTMPRPCAPCILLLHSRCASHLAAEPPACSLCPAHLYPNPRVPPILPLLRPAHPHARAYWLVATYRPDLQRLGRCSQRSKNGGIPVVDGCGAQEGVDCVRWASTQKALDSEA